MKTNNYLITNEMKAYLAGLFDGEGSVNIFKQPSRKDMKSSAYFVEISIGNTHKGVLKWVLEHFGGRLTHNAERYTKRNQRTWRWRASSHEAYEILIAMRPYLIVKQEQAQVAIEFREHQVAFKAHGHNPITTEEEAWRENQRMKLRSMRTWKDEAGA
jgi:hypothetical protein